MWFLKYYIWEFWPYCGKHGIYEVTWKILYKLAWLWYKLWMSDIVCAWNLLILPREIIKKSPLSYTYSYYLRFKGESGFKKNHFVLSQHFGIQMPCQCYKKKSVFTLRNIKYTCIQHKRQHVLNLQLISKYIA